MSISRRKDYDANQRWKKRTRARGQLAAMCEMVRDLNIKIKAAQKEISDLTPKSGDYSISDHAILRFLEHTSGLDINDVMASMDLNSLFAPDESRMEFTVIRNGLEFIVKDRCILTIMPHPQCHDFNRSTKAGNAALIARILKDEDLNRALYDIDD